MRYPHLYEIVHFRPWLILPSFHAAIAAVLDSRIAGESFSGIQPQAKVSTEGMMSGASEFAPASVDADGIATIQVNGIIAKGASAFEKSCYGGVSPEDVTRSLAAASGNPDVRGIVLQVDSPGGTVGGVPEAADHIAAVQASGMPVFAFADGLMASAAYWLSAGASRIYSTRLADVGSIGVYVPWMDRSVQYAKAGISVDVIKDGKFKAAGFPGTRLSEDDRARIQADVNRIGTDFREHVSKYRSRVPRSAMEGQAFLGVDAAEQGLVDGIVSGLSDVKARLRLTLPTTTRT